MRLGLSADFGAVFHFGLGLIDGLVPVERSQLDGAELATAFAPAGFTLSLSRLGPRRPPIAGAGSPRDGP